MQRNPKPGIDPVRFLLSIIVVIVEKNFFLFPRDAKKSMHIFQFTLKAIRYLALLCILHCCAR